MVEMLDLSPNTLILGWCTLLCLEDNTKYSAAINKLEATDGLGLSEVDIVAGNKVIWCYRGAPYEAEILEIHGEYA